MQLGIEAHMRGRHRDDWIRALGLRTVIDVGANRGQFAKEIRGILPKADIISFEPLPVCHPSLEALAARDPRLRVVKVGISDRNGVEQFNMNDFSASSSLLPLEELHVRNFPFTARTNPIEIEVRTLDDAISELDLVPEIMVKIDVQGVEDRVIAGGALTLARCRLVLCEVSYERLYRGQPLFEDIHRRMTALGFTYMGSWDQIWSPIDGRALSGDATYLRA